MSSDSGFFLKKMIIKLFHNIWKEEFSSIQTNKNQSTIRIDLRFQIKKFSSIEKKRPLAGNKLWKDYNFFFISMILTVMIIIKMTYMTCKFKFDTCLDHLKILKKKYWSYQWCVHHWYTLLLYGLPWIFSALNPRIKIWSLCCILRCIVSYENRWW